MSTAFTPLQTADMLVRLEIMRGAMRWKRSQLVVLGYEPDPDAVSRSRGSHITFAAKSHQRVVAHLPPEVALSANRQWANGHIMLLLESSIPLPRHLLSQPGLTGLDVG